MVRQKILLKFGGSVITDKKSNTPTINQKNLDKISKTLNTTNYDIIIVHGAGSFGHPIAKKFKLEKGLNSTINQKTAIKNVREQVLELNKIICNVLHKINIKTQTIIPSDTMETIGSRKIKEFPLELFNKAIESGNVPITFGDVTNDSLQGITILSGDVIMLELAKIYKPLLTLFIMDLPGVFDGNPSDKESKVIPLVNHSTLEALKKNIISNKVIDVTGGLIGKLECAMEISNYSETWITNLDALKECLEGKPHGSQVVI